MSRTRLQRGPDCCVFAAWSPSCRGRLPGGITLTNGNTGKSSNICPPLTERIGTEILELNSSSVNGDKEPAKPPR